VSVVIPCHNYAHYLRECVNSALDQDGVDIEVIIVDDASTDDTSAICNELARDPRVRVITHQTNRGHIATFNDGLAAATGSYVALVSADDLLVPGALVRAAAVFEARPDVGLVYGYAKAFVGAPPRNRRRHRPWAWTVWSGQEWLTEVCRRGRNPMYSPEAVMRTSILQRTGLYETSLPHTSDLFMWLCAAGSANVAYIDGCDQAFYRLHNNSLSATAFGTRLADITERLRAFDVFFERHGVDHDREQLEPLVRAVISREALRAACDWYDHQGVGDDPAELSAVSVRLWPDIRGTKLWRAYEVRRSRWERVGRRSPFQAVRHRVEQWRMVIGRGLERRRFLHFGV
jgi:glycosyltransferase involved in cell wall biosynthesis